MAPRSKCSRITDSFSPGNVNAEMRFAGSANWIADVRVLGWVEQISEGLPGQP
jgi:hypothetical protein